MMIGIYSSKRALIDALDALTGSAEPLEGVEVTYSVPGEFGLKTIYGGGIRFTHTDDVAESPGILVREQASASLYLRAVAKLPAEVRDTDVIVEGMANTIMSVFKANPNLGDGVTWQGVTAGQSDYFPDSEQVTSILALQVSISRLVNYA